MSNTVMFMPRPSGNLLWGKKVFFGSFIGRPVFGCNGMTPMVRGFQKGTKALKMLRDQAYKKTIGSGTQLTALEVLGTLRQLESPRPDREQSAHHPVSIEKYQFSSARFKANASNVLFLEESQNTSILSKYNINNL